MDKIYKIYGLGVVKMVVICGHENIFFLRIWSLKYMVVICDHENMWK